MDAPNYVQGLYTVAQRDAIFAKADKYPDASDGLQNQVPTIFPDGSIGWRQIPEGGDGTANANIAVIESTQYASRDYAVNDLLIYNGQLYRVSTPIAAGGTITPETNVVSTTVALWAPESFVPIVGKGVNLLDNAYFIGGGAAGQFPVNQRGQTGASAYPNEGGTVDRWVQPAGCITGWENGVFTVKLAGYYSSFRQYLDESALTEGQKYTLSVVSATGLHSFTFTASKSTGAQSEGYENGLYFYVAWTSDTSKWLVNLATNGAQSSTLISFQPKAAKLELGTQQTLARQVNGAWVLNDTPPNYQQELAKCQRYLLVFHSGQEIANMVYYQGTLSSIVIPTPTTMAAVPIPMLTGTVEVSHRNSSAPTVCTLPAQTVGISPNSVLLYIQAGSAFPDVGTVHLGTDSKLILSAE